MQKAKFKMQNWVEISAQFRLPWILVFARPKLIDNLASTISFCIMHYAFCISKTLEVL